MQDFPQPIATERHSHADEHIGPDLAPSNGDDASKIAFAMAAAASASGLPSITSQAMLSDIPSCIVHEDLEEAADLDIDDLPVVANTASELPCASNLIVGSCHSYFFRQSVLDRQRWFVRDLSSNGRFL
jgi:hypothetical protein